MISLIINIFILAGLITIDKLRDKHLKEKQDLKEIDKLASKYVNDIVDEWEV